MKYVLVSTVNLFFEVLNILVFVRVLLSWFRYDPYNKFIILLFQLTDPILEPIKKLVRKFNIETGMVDFSPLLAMLALYYLIRPAIIYLILIFVRG